MERNDLLQWIKRKRPTTGWYHNGGLFGFPTLEINVWVTETGVKLEVYCNSDPVEVFEFTNEEIEQ